MSERVSEAVGPENGDDFLRKVSPTTQREWHQRRSQLLHSHGTPTFGAICKRSGQNTSSRSGDTKISARPNPHKYAAASTVQKWPLGIIRSHPTGNYTRNDAGTGERAVGGATREGAPSDAIKYTKTGVQRSPTSHTGR